MIIAGAVASTVLMAVMYEPGTDPSRVYYGTDTRAAGPADRRGAGLPRAAVAPQPQHRGAGAAG